MKYNNDSFRIAAHLQAVVLNETGSSEILHCIHFINVSKTVSISYFDRTVIYSKETQVIIMHYFARSVSGVLVR